MSILWKVVLAMVLAVFGFGAFGGHLLGLGVGGSLFVAALCVTGLARESK